MHKQRYFFILLLKRLGLHFQRCKTEKTSGMSLEGLAAEICLVETLKESTESNILLFSSAAPTQKKLNTKHTHMCTQSHQQLVLPQAENCKQIQSSLIPPSTSTSTKSLIQSLSLVGRTTGNPPLCFSLIYFILLAKTSVSTESDLSLTLFISLQVFSSYR